MKKESMTSMQRVLTTLGHQEPDRVPLFLLLSMHGARELGISIREYFSQAKYVVEGQLRLRAKYHTDLFYPFFYGPLEVEAWGAEVLYVEDGPPNSAEPLIQNPEEILRLEPPDVKGTPCLTKGLEAIRQLKVHARDEVPIIGVAISPFSLPVMQLGFDRYIEVLYERPDLFERLMRVNEEFCVNWANAQLEAGATAICYFDPVSSTTVSTPAVYEKTGFEIAKRVLSRINGPTATHMASGNCLPIIDLIAQTGTAGLGVGCNESLKEIKSACKGRLTVIGNMNGIAMRNWSEEEAEQIVKRQLAQAGPGGGYILSDSHGETPWQVSDKTLLAISESVQKWGHYPLDWIQGNE